MQPFGIHARFDGSFDEALAKVTDALKSEGFVYEQEDGATHVAAIDQIETIAARGEPALKEVAREVHDKLERAMSLVGGRP